MNEPSQENLLEIASGSHDLPDLTRSLFSDSLIETAPPARGEKYIVFFSGGELYAVSSKQIAEVVNPLRVSALPFAPAWLNGIAGLRGEIISVIDLQKLLEKAAQTSPAPKSKFIVLNAKNAHHSVALTVERLSEVVTIANEQIQFAGENSSFLLGTAAHASGAINVLDAQKILSLTELAA
jgi:purine-binding chemotaxis protein CheW